MHRISSVTAFCICTYSNTACNHGAIIWVGITFKKILVISATQSAGGLLLRKLKYLVVMLSIFEFSWVWENIESWFVNANKLFWIAQPYFLTNIIKQSYCQLFFLAFQTFNHYHLPKLKKSHCFIYIAIAKNCWVIKLGKL